MKCSVAITNLSGGAKGTLAKVDAEDMVEVGDVWEGET